jgi:hypothetical protein
MIEPELPELPIGAHVRVGGTLGEVYTVVLKEPGRPHGVWYTFRSNTTADLVRGYREAVMPWDVVALPADA